MRRLAVGALLALAAMVACAWLGWGRGASPAFGLGFMASTVAFGVCWSLLVMERRR